MKSRTSFFDLTVFRKNLTRFAAAWGLYTLCLLLCLMLTTSSGLEYWLPAGIGDFLQIMPVINCGYALLVAQLLFGDLFNSRMCNAIHAMPIRRENLFVTNVTAGLVFSLGPTLVMTLVALPLVCMSKVVNGWQIPLLWLLGANLQYLFFFAVAVLCVFCVGSRFAMALVYAIINLGANVVYWLVDTLYTPMLYGVRTQYEDFQPFFPVGQMVTEPYFELTRHNDTWGYLTHAEFSLMDNWGYLWLCAGLALVLLAAALLLYRKRKLECAGDFMAVRPLEPVFLVIYSLVMAAMFHMVHQIFLSDNGWVFLIVGLAVGFFTGRMLLERRGNVFRKKNWAAFGLLTLAVAGSLVLTWLDPLGIETWVPRAENLDRVILSLGDYYHYSSASLPLTEQEDMENALYVHEQAILDGRDEYNVSRVGFTITYEMKNGTTVNRYYTVRPESAEGQLLKGYFSSLYCVIGTDDLTSNLDGASIVYVDGWDIPAEYYTREDIAELAAAIEADCAAGLLAQSNAFHEDSAIGEETGYCVSSVHLDLVIGGFGTAFSVYGDSENTLAWLEEHGILEYVWHEWYGEKYR